MTQRNRAQRRQFEKDLRKQEVAEQRKRAALKAQALRKQRRPFMWTPPEWDARDALAALGTPASLSEVYEKYPAADYDPPHDKDDLERALDRLHQSGHVYRVYNKSTGEILYSVV